MDPSLYLQRTHSGINSMKFSLGALNFTEFSAKIMIHFNWSDISLILTKYLALRFDSVEMENNRSS